MTDPQNVSVAVCVAPGQRTNQGAARVGDLDARALGMALAIGQAPAVLSVNVTDRSEVEPYFGVGARQIEALACDDRHIGVEDSLAERLRQIDPKIILMGAEAGFGLGSGTVPYLVAARLSIPVLRDVVSITAFEAYADVVQAMAWGKRKLIRVGYPFLAAVGGSAPNVRGYSHRRAVEGVLSGTVSASLPEESRLIDDRNVRGRRKQALTSHALTRLAGLHGDAASPGVSSGGGPAVVDGLQGARILVDALKKQRVLPHLSSE